MKASTAERRGDGNEGRRRAATRKAAATKLEGGDEEGGDEEGGDEEGGDEEGGDEEGGDEESGNEEGGDEGDDTIVELKLPLHARAYGSCEQQYLFVYRAVAYLCVPSG